MFMPETGQGACQSHCSAIDVSFMEIGSGDPSISIPVGITVGLLASFVQSLGLTIQRKSHVLNQALPEEQQKVEHRRPYVFRVFPSSPLLILS